MVYIKKLNTPAQISHSDKYWELVRRTLKDIFSKYASDANPLEREVNNMPPDEQFLFYHSEALSIASEIADEIPTPSQIDRYKHLRGNIFGIP